ncbi:MAG: alpha/beta hydrolase [Alistipes sp.]|nr:alpha/beta hydrolase [Alistipes sp.]
MKQFIDIEDIKLCYEVAGEGKPVIILHGWGCSKDTVQSITDHISKTHRAYALDMPGFGETPPPSEVFGIERYTQVVEKFCQKLNIENPILIGHSFGGRISILFSSRNQTSKVMLVDAAGIVPKRTLKYHIKVRSYKIYKKLLPLFVGKQEVERRIEERRNRSGSADYRAAQGIMRAVFVKIVNEDLKYVMPKIKAPTLMIWGELDTATPLSDARTMEKLIKGSGVAVMKGCGHYSFLDNPRQFFAIVDAFLNS